ncbi:MAG: hypothetical protein QNJ81_02590 [Acidimicrobiia bacterium]|nr:hypothetical protein [Acidimicrobiia bacterium]
MTSIIASGCSSFAELIPFEQDKIEASGTTPVPKCEWPELNEGVIDGRDVVYMEAYDLGLQMRCQETEQANHDIAADNAEAVDETVAAFNTLVDKAEVHHQNALNELERVDDARKAALVEGWTVKGVLAAVLIAVAL